MLTHHADTILQQVCRDIKRKPMMLDMTSQNIPSFINESRTCIYGFVAFYLGIKAWKKCAFRGGEYIHDKEAVDKFLGIEPGENSDRLYLVRKWPKAYQDFWHHSMNPDDRADTAILRIECFRLNGNAV